MDPSVPVPKDHIKLDQFLKWQGLADSGGAAKFMIQQGAVKVNGQVETQRGRKLRNGDTVQTSDRTMRVDLAAQ